MKQLLYDAFVITLLLDYVFIVNILYYRANESKVQINGNEIFIYEIFNIMFIVSRNISLMFFLVYAFYCFLEYLGI